jgi:hypothetical protein
MAKRNPQSESDHAGNQPVDEQTDLQPAIDEDAAINRRDLLKLTASAIIAAPLVGLTDAQGATSSTIALNILQGKSAATKAPLFFTKEELALVDELSEIIIPTDAHSPGARAAGCAAYIDARLAEAFEDAPRQTWRDGLKLIESLSQEMHGRPFLQSTPEQRLLLMTRIAQNENNPGKPEEVFFKELKSRAAHAYYSSKIGIHQEIEYKGNTYLKEFVGYDAK